MVKRIRQFLRRLDIFVDWRDAPCRESGFQSLEDLPRILRQCDLAILRLRGEAYQAAMDAYEAGDDRKELAAARGFMAVAKELGLSPSARRIVKPAPIEKKEFDFQKWLTRRNSLM